MTMTQSNGPIDPWPFSTPEGGGGSDPWPFSLPTESASALLESMLKGRTLLVLGPDTMPTADFNPNRVQVRVDANRRVLAVKFG